ncbi:putative NRPS-like enzyme [Stipitochalara longipes BDJ]|nr:putative NRPS-like enzyme [Stipitochalara longipes BDJ]
MDNENKKIYTFDQLICQRGKDEDQTPLFAFPKSRLGVTDYELITGKKLHQLVDGAAKALLHSGLIPMTEETVVGVFSVSDLDYLVNVYALGRLGYTSFLISPRLPPSTVANLLTSTNAQILFHAPEHVQLAEETKNLTAHALQTFIILHRSIYDNPDDSSPLFSRNVDPITEQDRRYIMLHSSGSTGLPKPIHYTNCRLLITCLTSPSLIAFQSLPFSHAHGLVTYSQAIWTKKTLYLFNNHVPQTNSTLCSAIEAATPEIVWTVPYVLKLLAESERGIQALKNCKVVSSSGSRCPDELGDLLTSRDVFLGCLFGSTEASLLFTSLTRPRDDEAWNYLRAPAHVLPYLLMKPILDGSSICECVVLDGHRGKSVSNSNSPPNSFYTSDLFIAHPTIPNAWKFIGRADDRVTLLNGEKVLPLPIEGRIVQDPLIKEAVVFGVDRPVPGLLLFRADTEEATKFSEKEFLDHVWPSIEDANRKAEAFSQIGKSMVVVVEHNKKFPETDKSTVKRGQLYKEFEAVIEDTYTRLDGSNGQTGALVLELHELESWLIEAFRELGLELHRDSDFFSFGVDSLKAIHIRGLIIQTLDLGENGESLPSMLVYDCGSIMKLSQKLFDLRMGSETEIQDELALMQDMIEQYCILPKREPGASMATGKNVVILTGATGFLGAHLLSELVASPHIAKIYCLIRPTTTQTPTSRLASVLQKHHLGHLITSPKISCLACNLTLPSLGLPAATLSTLTAESTYIFHCAWMVNFALPLQSFRPDLAGVQNLLKLSLTTTSRPEPAQFIFCSSIAAALGTVPPALIPQTILELLQASKTGYGRSKAIAEHVCEQAVRNSGVRAKVVRIGQIVPSRRDGASKLWNVNEIVPLLTRSALVTGVLPDRSNGGDSCDWIEVDVVSKLICELAEFSRENGNEERVGRFLYNVVHPMSFSWRYEFLPKLKESGMAFEVVGYREWLQKLQKSEDDLEKNPSRKLLGFWASQNWSGNGEIQFDTNADDKTTLLVKTEPRVVDGDLVTELVAAWMKVW